MENRCLNCWSSGFERVTKTVSAGMIGDKQVTRNGLFCRYYPPVALKHASEIVTVFPEVQPDWICAFHKYDPAKVVEDENKD